MCFKRTNLKLDRLLDKVSQWVKDKRGRRSSLTLTESGPVGIGTERPAEMLEVNGNVKANAFFGDGSRLSGIVHPGLPRGTIVMWHGELAALPRGWALCDGRNATPDLRDRFICGTGGMPGEMGGEREMQLGVDHLPAHSHPCEASGQHTHAGNATPAGDHLHQGTTSSTGTHTHSQAPTNPAGEHNHDFNGSGPNKTAFLYNCENRTGIYQWKEIDQNCASAGVHAHPNPDTDSAGNHDHILDINAGGDHAHNLELTQQGNHVHTSGPTGTGRAFDKRPPYYKIFFIMKL